MTDTHCPYCSLQCGMRLARRGPAHAGGAGLGRVPGQRGRRCAARAGPPPACSGTASGSPRRSCGTGRPGSSARRRGTSALDVVADRLRDLRAAHGPDTVGGLRRRRADQREGLPARQVRPGRARHQPDRLQRPLVHVLGGVGGHPRVRRRPRAAVPARRRRADRRARAGRLQPRRDDAAGRAPPRRAARARRPGRGDRPAADPDRASAPTCSCSRSPAPTWRSPSALLHLLVAERPGRRGVRRGAHHRLRRRTPLGRRVVARAGRAGHRRPGRRGARTGACWASAPRVIVLTARGAEQHSQGTDTVLAVDQPGARARPVRPGVRRLRLPHRPGQRPGRPRARPEGRPAARLPDDRRPRRPRARRRGVGRPAGVAARARGARRTSCSTRSAPTADRALLVFGSNIVVSAPNATHVTRRLEALDLLVVADIVLSETAALADVVLPVTQWAEETGTMTNLEGRVLLRQRAVTPPAGVRSDLDVLAGWRSGSARRCRSRPTPRRSSPSSAAPRRAARPTTPASPTTGSATSTASSGPAPTPDHPGTPRMFVDALRHPGRPGPLPRRRAPRPGRAAVRRLPAAPDHRPGARPVPVRRPDPAGPRRCPTPAVRRAAPDAGRTDRRRRRRAGPGQHPPRHR